MGRELTGRAALSLAVAAAIASCTPARVTQPTPAAAALPAAPARPEVKLEFRQGAGPKGCGCDCKELSPHVLLPGREGAPSPEIPFESCPTLLSLLREEAPRRTLTTSAGPVEERLGVWRLPSTSGFNPLEQSCEALLKDQPRCEDTFRSVKVSLLSLVGAAASVEESTSGAGGGAAPWALRSWKTVDLVTGAPAPLTDFVEEKALVTALEKALAPRVKPAELAAAKTSAALVELLPIQGQRPKLSAFSFGEYRKPSKTVVVQLGLNERPDGAPSATEVTPLTLELPVRPEKLQAFETMVRN